MTSDYRVGGGRPPETADDVRHASHDHDPACPLCRTGDALGDVHTITDAQWRAVMDPNGCDDDAHWAAEAVLTEYSHEAGAMARSPAGEAAFTRLREIAERLTQHGRDHLRIACDDSGTRHTVDPDLAGGLAGAGLVSWGRDPDGRYYMRARPLGRAAIAYLGGRTTEGTER